MSTTLSEDTARRISPSASRYEPRVITNGISVVTPPVTAWRLSVPQSEAEAWAALPRCRCVSMSPGTTKRPSASMVRRAVTASPGRSTAAIDPSRMASPQSTKPSGLTTRQSRTNRSASIGSARGLDHVAVGVRAAGLHEAPEVAHVVARLGVDVGVEDLARLVARAGHHPAFRIDEERRAEVVTIGRAADILAHLVDAAHVEHVGDGVATQPDLPDVADPVAIGRGRYQEQMRAPQAEHPGGLRKVAVVADEDADLEAERRIEDWEAEVAGLKEEALVAGRLSCLHGAENLGDG